MDNKIKLEKYEKALLEVLANLRSIEGPNEADEYIDCSIEIITKVLCKN